jgi:putative SOS response-associated peptidase YedK
MCGRYYVDEETSMEIQKILSKIDNRINKTNMKTGEIFPSELAPILVAKNDNIVPEIFKWGAPGFEKSKQIINARSESVYNRKMFSESILQRRCIIPANGFFEWSHLGTKKKYYFTDYNSDIIYMAGIYDKYQGTDCFIILTTAANQSMSDVHDRMPLLFNRQEMEDWLMDEKQTSNLLGKIPYDLRKEESIKLNKDYEQLSFDFLNSK